MDRSSKILLVILIVLIIVSILFAYYRFFVVKDFTIINSEEQTE